MYVKKNTIPHFYRINLIRCTKIKCQNYQNLRHWRGRVANSNDRARFSIFSSPTYIFPSKTNVDGLFKLFFPGKYFRLRRQLNGGDFSDRLLSCRLSCLAPGMAEESQWKRNRFPISSKTLRDTTVCSKNWLLLLADQMVFDEIGSAHGFLPVIISFFFDKRILFPLSIH